MPNKTFAEVTGVPYGKTKEEHRAYYEWYRNRDLADYNAKRKAWADSHKERRQEQSRKSYLKKLYGITEEEFNKLLQQQNYKCAICGLDYVYTPEGIGRKRYNLEIDHNHKTGTIRGLLCHNCNKGLGRYKDDIEVLQKAIDYIKAGQ